MLRLMLILLLITGMLVGVFGGHTVPVIGNPAALVTRVAPDRPAGTVTMQSYKAQAPLAGLNRTDWHDGVLAQEVMQMPNALRVAWRLIMLLSIERRNLPVVPAPQTTVNLLRPEVKV